MLPQAVWHWAYRRVVLVVRPSWPGASVAGTIARQPPFGGQSLAGHNPRAPLIQRSSRLRRPHVDLPAALPSARASGRESVHATRGQPGTAGPAALREHGVDGLRKFRGPGVAPAERVARNSVAPPLQAPAPCRIPAPTTGGTAIKTTMAVHAAASAARFTRTPELSPPVQSEDTA